MNNQPPIPTPEQYKNNEIQYEDTTIDNLPNPGHRNSEPSDSLDEILGKFQSLTMETAIGNMAETTSNDEAVDEYDATFAEAKQALANQLKIAELRGVSDFLNKLGSTELASLQHFAMLTGDRWLYDFCYLRQAELARLETEWILTYFL